MVSVQQMTNLMEQNVNLQSWINKYINTIESLEEQIKQCQTDLAREKEKS
jgi:flagellar biosynthesis chaperone FliJ